MALAANVTGLNAASGQAVSLLAGVLTPVWTALLAWKAQACAHGDSTLRTDPRARFAGALFAGLIVAFSTLAVGSSLVAMADMAGVHWATLGTLLAVIYLRNEKQRLWLGLLAGLCLGLAAVTRYIYPLLLAPVALFAIVGGKADLRQGVSHPSRQLGKPAGVRHASPLLVFAPPLVLLSLQLLHNLIHPTPGLPSPVIGAWDPLNAFRSSFEGPDGRQSYSQPVAFFYLVRPLLSTSSLGPALALFFGLGLIALYGHDTRRSAALLLSWWLLFAGFYSGTTYQTDRFVLSYLPPLAIIAGLGLSLSLAWMARARSAWPVTSARKRALFGGFLVLLLALVGLGLQAQAAVTAHRAVVATKADYLAAAGCLKSAASDRRDVPVFTFGVSFALEEYSQVKARELYFESSESIAVTLSNSRGDVRGLLALPQHFEAQWSNTTMGHAVRHLTQNYRLAELPCPGTTFSLFEIR
jgi:hypothetical protein